MSVADRPVAGGVSAAARRDAPQPGQSELWLQLPPADPGLDFRAGDPLPDEDDFCEAVLSGTAHLPPLNYGPPAPCGAAGLDAGQRDALGRAWRSPDVFLIQGPAGTGKTTVAVELVRRAVAGREKILLLLPEPSAKPAWRERLAASSAAVVYSPDDPPPIEIARRSLAERQAESARDPREHFRRLHDLAAEWDRLKQELTALHERRAKVADEVERHCADRRTEPEFLATLDRLKQQAEAARAEAAAAEHEAEKIRTELERSRPLAEARQSNRWWTGAFWKAKAAGNLEARVAALTAERERWESIARAAARRADDHGRRHDELRGEDDRRQLERRDALVRRRTAELEEHIAAVRQKCDELRSHWFAECLRQPRTGPWPPQPCSQSVARAIAEGEAARSAAAAELQSARDWLAELERLAPELPDFLRRRADVVVVTPSELAELPDQPFDRLIVDDAHRLDEPDFRRAARRARRWLLVGEPPTREPRPQPGRPSAHKPFTLLWYALHRDIWTHEGGRILCRLRDVPPPRRAGLESESVADHPDIELRFDTPPDGVPQLAEVVFPAGTDLGQAKEFIFRHLEEAPIPVCGDPCWVEEPGRLVLHMHGSHPIVGTAQLEAGVRELIASRPQPPGLNGTGPLPWFTSGLEFATDRWGRDQAEQWVRSQLGRHDLGRTAKLDRPHRYAPAIAAAVAEWFPPGELLPSDAPPGGSVEFVPVPNQPPPEAVGRRIGAGLETETADGVSNEAEAQAVVEWCARTDAAVVVLALYRAQAERIRELIADRPALRDRVRVDTPEAWRHREADTVVVSLTRSHASRAVPYGDRPDWLALALTRARRRLVIVGDPGCLSRRGNWDGPLPPREPQEARSERHLARKLARTAEGSRPRPERPARSVART